MTTTIERVDIFALADAHFKLLHPSLQTGYGQPGVNIAHMVLQTFSQSLSDTHVLLLAPVETEVRSQEAVVKQQVHEEVDTQLLEEMRDREYAEAQARLQQAALEKQRMEFVEKQQAALRQEFTPQPTQNYPPVEEATDSELEQMEAEIEGGYEQPEPEPQSRLVPQPESQPRRFSPAELAAAERQKMEDEKARQPAPTIQQAPVSRTEDRPTALLDKLRAYKAGIRGGK
jgi:hypothetical protein